MYDNLIWRKTDFNCAPVIDNREIDFIINLIGSDT